MRSARIDRINSLGRFAAGLFCLILYFVFAELVLNFTTFKDIGNELDYYIAQSFTETERKDAEQFNKDLISCGERAEIVPGTTLYKYKAAKTKSFTINSFGFRGEELTKKERNEYRIVIFGDSKLLGYLLPDKDTIPVLVQEKLRKHFKNKGKRINVVNFGIEAFDIQRSIEAARLYLFDLESDFIVFYSAAVDLNEAYSLGGNDLIPFAEGDALPEIFRARSDNNVFMLKILQILNFAFFSDFYETESNALENEKLGYPVPPHVIQNLNDFPKSYAARIKKASDYFKAWGVPTLFILPPIPQFKNPLSEIEKKILFQREFYTPGINQFTEECYVETIKQVEQQSDVKVVNHSEMFDGMDETVFFDGLHMTPKANRMAAEKMAGDLIKILESEHYLEKK
ncbi:SGNH/GDSL hydrolase family protein [bacterium]|nr:SGNH/GDSL hydrolase family protein [bacterium]